MYASVLDAVSGTHHGPVIGGRCFPEAFNISVGDLLRTLESLRILESRGRSYFRGYERHTLQLRGMVLGKILDVEVATTASPKALELDGV